jgi:hypothetical protein
MLLTQRPQLPVPYLWMDGKWWSHWWQDPADHMSYVMSRIISIIMRFYSKKLQYEGQTH